jgi:hypothetical protein
MPDERERERRFDDLAPKEQTKEQAEQVKGGFEPVDNSPLKKPIRTIDVPNG